MWSVAVIMTELAEGSVWDLRWLYGQVELLAIFLRAVTHWPGQLDWLKPIVFRSEYLYLDNRPNAPQILDRGFYFGLIP